MGRKQKVNLSPDHSFVVPEEVVVFKMSHRITVFVLEQAGSMNYILIVYEELMSSEIK